MGARGDDHEGHEEHEGWDLTIYPIVIGCAIEVHRELGQGVLESTYEQCLVHELRLHGMSFQLQQLLIPVRRMARSRAMSPVEVPETTNQPGGIRPCRDQ